MGRRRKDGDEIDDSAMAIDSGWSVPPAPTELEPAPNMQHHADTITTVKGVERYGKQVFKPHGAIPKMKRKTGAISTKQKKRQQKKLKLALTVAARKGTHLEKLDKHSSVREKAKNLY